MPAARARTAAPSRESARIRRCHGTHRNQAADHLRASPAASGAGELLGCMGRWFAFTFSECRHGSNETFASQTGFFLGRPDGRKQNARAEEVAGVASPHPRRLFAV